jgi:hypothetical protein
MTMPKEYLHIELSSFQISKKPQWPCGDAIMQQRSDSSTDFSLCDGIGSGYKAHIAAGMCISRLRALLQAGFSMHRSFSTVASTINRWRTPDMPYAAFSMIRILNDGEASILSYDAPSPILVSGGHACVLPERPLLANETVAMQSSCFLVPEEGLLLFTDGVTQAGIGNGLRLGWGAQGVAYFVTELLAHGIPKADIPHKVCQKAFELSGCKNCDDISAVYAACRKGVTVNLFTGPPIDEKKDDKIVGDFISSGGTKVVCGATTAGIVSRVLGKKLDIVTENMSLIAPPKYLIEGIDLVTEGAVTLNQLNNIIDLDESVFDDVNPVTELYDMLIKADRVIIMLGKKHNPANEGMSFTQTGILTREKIVPILAKKLESKGKLVIIKQF